MTTTADDTPGALAPVRRRRELGQASARSLLMTVLGEYALRPGLPVWTLTLVRAMATLGVEEKSARQALARSCTEGWLASQRQGRQARWTLTEPGRRLLSEGADRIYSFRSKQQIWDGRWLVLLVSVPEAKRELRHRLRTRLSWAGFGSPAAGVWVCPDAGREREKAGQILAELGLAGASMSFLAGYGGIGGQDRLVAQAWDLAAVAGRYRQFIDAFEPLRPGGDTARFTAQTMLVHEWRRFPFLDPQLPAELLGEDWIGAAAARLFHDRHAQWRAGAVRHWQLLASPDIQAADS